MSRVAVLSAALTLLFAVAPEASAQWVWPISGTAVADPMNTSFGPRINDAMWDFHDGIDLPTPIGTDVRAVAAGTVFREGPGGTDGYSSRHVVVRIDPPSGGPLFAVYLHLSAIEPGITEGAAVAQGAVLGQAGDDDATYPHLHFEVRRGAAIEISSVHPLQYLPYLPTSNFTAPVLDRSQQSSAGLLVRFTFTSATKDEGDLRSVEVDFLAGAAVLETRRVDLDDKLSVNEGRSDQAEFRNGIALEGYQRSNMVGDGRTDLHYGILVRGVPPACDAFLVRVLDWGGAIATGGPFPRPTPVPFGDHLDFEGAFPPAGWVVATSGSGTGTTLASSGSAALVGSGGLLATDASSAESTSQVAALERALPAGRIGWTAEGLFRPDARSLAAGQNAYLLYFRNGTGLSACATMRNNSGTVQAGVLVRNPDASTTSQFSSVVPAVAVARRWTVDLFRIGTRETTIVLFLDGVEIARKVWDGRTYLPDGFRAALGFTSAGATATLSADEIRIGDGGLASFPAFRAGEVTNLGIAKNGLAAANLDLAWNAACTTAAALDYAVEEGALGTFSGQAAALCSTAGALVATVTPAAGDRWFVVVPRSAAGEGTRGTDSLGNALPRPLRPCADAPDPGCG